MPDLFSCARACIAAVAVAEKLSLTREYARAWQGGELSLDATASPAPLASPGRPERPPLVHAAAVTARKLSTRTGRAAFLHALAHIEFNAINLAWDAVCRFRDLPREFYSDWVRVADEEAMHFGMLRQRLRAMGHEYGDFPAHDGLWDMARRTAHDPLVRMALVPRVLEARGLDVTPSMIARLQQTGDQDSARVLEKILDDEIRHVEAGSRWFDHLCRQRGLDPLETFRALLVEFMPGRIRTPLNTRARALAGFNDREIQLLQDVAMERT